jgi:O-antigen/teichoic acid export membrane protein
MLRDSTWLSVADSQMLDRRKFLTDWGVNLAGVALLGITGVALNAGMAQIYGAQVLGIFNQVYAIYIVGSQLATFGMQFSVLKYVAEFDQDEDAVARSMTAALVAVMCWAAATVAIFFTFFRYSPSQLFSREVAVGVFYMLPGLWCFALNKVLLSAFNGLQANKLYALYVGLRYLLMLLFFLGALLLKVPGEKLPIILSLSEGVLLFSIIPVYRRIFRGQHRLGDFAWLRRHIYFGAHSILGGLAVELNTRVDVLVLGVFTNDSTVGIYSFAALFVEGLMQLSVMARRLIDPMLTRLAVQQDVDGRTALLLKGRNLGALFMGSVTAAMTFTYPWYATWLAGAEIAEASWGVFSILAVGACVFATYATFGGIFSQSGLPMLQSRMNLAILAMNLGLNLVMVPPLGLLGAAIATSLSFMTGALYLKFLIWRHLSIKF